MKKKPATPSLVSRLESYISKFVAFPSKDYTLPLALWTLGTFCFQEFDAFPYLIITSATKRSGKTRLAEVLSMACANPYNFAAVTPAVMFRLIEQANPTILYDEAETLSSEAASTMRAVLNVGYKKGQTIPRIVKDSVVNFPTYCPKVFVLIGDTYDTLRDRSIIITMERSSDVPRSTRGEIEAIGTALREEAKVAVKSNTERIAALFATHEALGFLQDREEEIWLPLFVLCSIFCPDRKAELSKSAVDLATEKTAEARRYTQLHEDADEDAGYAEKLLLDLYALLLTVGPSVGSAEAIPMLQDVPTAPWRRFRGRGLRVHDMANLLSRFGVRPVVVTKGHGRKEQTTMRGYRKADVENAVRRLK